MNELAGLLLQSSDRALDAQLKPMIREWSDPPAARQVLKVLDLCINGSLADGFTVAVLQALYDTSCKDEGKTHDEVVREVEQWGERI